MVNASILHYQHLLALAGCYPPRLGFDGIPGNGYKVGVIAFKRRLQDLGVDKGIWWPTSRKVKDLAILDTITAAKLEEACRLGSVDGVPFPLVPHDEQLTSTGVTRDGARLYLVELYGTEIPVDLFLSMVEHESRWRFTVRAGDHTIIQWGADYSGPDVRYPTDLERIDLDTPIISRGWGPCQLTPPQVSAGAWVGHRMPPADPWGPESEDEWPFWITNVLHNLSVGCGTLFASKFKYKSSLRRKCSWRDRHACRDCLSVRWPSGGYEREATQTRICSWLEAVRRFAGSGAGADEMVTECRDILLK